MKLRHSSCPIPLANHFGFFPMFHHHLCSCTSQILYHHFERPMADGDGPTWQHTKSEDCSCPCSSLSSLYFHRHKEYVSKSFHHLQFCRCPFLLKGHAKHPALQHRPHQDLRDGCEYWRYGGSIQGPGVSRFYQHRLNGKRHHHKKSSHRGGHAHPFPHKQRLRQKPQRQLPLQILF